MDMKRTRTANGTFLAAFVLCLLAIAALSPPVLFAGRNGREERVREFGDSLGREVVKGAKPVAAGEREAIVARTAAYAGGAIVLAVGLNLLASRVREAKRRSERTLQYHTENLMTPASVRDHLLRVVDGRTPVSVWIDDHFIRFASRIVEVLPGRDVLSILPLAPAAGNAMIRSSARVRVEYLHHRVPYHFDTVRAGERPDSGTFVHELILPERIHFIQRRDRYRVEPPARAPLTFEAARRNDSPMPVLDIGPGGFAAAAGAPFRPGEELEGCRIGGPALLPLDFSCRCVYTQPIAEGKSKFRHRCGFRFLRMAADGDQRLAKFIATQQIQELSRRKAMER